MRKYLLIMLAFVFSISWSAMAVAQDQQTLAEKLLIILKQNHQITPEQYDQLLQEAQQQKAAQKAAVARQVKEQAAEAAKEYKEKHPLAAQAEFKNGELHLKSNDDNFSMHVGGVFEVDFGGAEDNAALRKAFSDANAVDGYGTEARRVRLNLSGTLYRDFDYMAEFAFDRGNASITDLWLTYKGMPCWANIKVGHMKEPFSLEELTSDKWLDFTERSLANGFVTQQGHDYDTGVMLFNTEFDKHMTWAAGGFMQQTDSTGSGTAFNTESYNNVNFTTRFTFLPWYCNGGCELVHLGIGYKHLFRSDNPGYVSGEAWPLQFENHPEWHMAPNLFNTGSIYANGADEVNPEVAFVYGPFSMQGEYFDAFLDNANNHNRTYSNPSYAGYYVMASYFLTGEHRQYNTGSGTFDRPKLCCNFDPAAGTWGAWELAARYSSVNFNDISLPSSLQGGQEQDWTGSLVWYLNPSIRVLFDYVHAHVDGIDQTSKVYVHNGDADIFDSRFQVAW